MSKYEIIGNDALKPMKFSSGGQKSRVAFASLTFGKPHVVIMDEVCYTFIASSAIALKPTQLLFFFFIFALADEPLGHGSDRGSYQRVKGFFRWSSRRES